MSVKYDPKLKIECLVCHQTSKTTAQGKLPKGWKFRVSYFLCPKEKIKPRKRRKLLKRKRGAKGKRILRRKSKK